MDDPCPITANYTCVNRDNNLVPITGGLRTTDVMSKTPEAPYELKKFLRGSRRGTT